MEGLKVAPKKHQLEAFHYMMESPYCILGLPPGMGKTLCPVLVANEIKNSRTLVVCPSYLALNWKSEINKYFKGKVVDVIKKGKDIAFPVDADFVIISYDLAVKAECLFQWANILVLDEANYIKNMDASRTQVIHQYIYENSIDRVYLLTGTPIKNRVDEFYSLISICNYNPRLKYSQFLNKFPDIISFADRFSHRDEYTIWKGYREVKILKWSGYKNEEELKTWLNGIYFTRAATYDPVTRKDIVVADADDIELKLAFEGFDSGSSIMPDVKAKAALLKAPLTVQYCKDLLESSQADSLVIFSDHVESAKHIAEKLNASLITGSVQGHRRKQIADEFQAGKIKIIVATVGSFSTGVTLTRSNNMVFNDFPWVPGDLEQAEHRINRLGQTRHCTYHRLIGSPQDQYILDVLEQKRQTIEKVT